MSAIYYYWLQFVTEAYRAMFVIYYYWLQFVTEAYRLKKVCNFL